jgi:hypothetical protein
MFANIAERLRSNLQAVNGNGATPQRRTLADLALLSWMAAESEAKEKHYDKLRHWYAGHHNVPLTDRQKEYLARDPDFEFSLNYLRKPVNACVERLTVVGFDGPEGIGGKDGLLWQWWQAANMDALQNQVHRQAMIDGDTYIITGWNNEENRPIFDHEPAYDGNEGVRGHYVSNTRRVMSFAFKRWVEDLLNESSMKIERVVRMNIYLPNEVTKYIESGQGLVPYTEPADPRWPIPWDAGIIPVEHFRWMDNGGNWGESEIEQLIPAQMLINKSVLDEAEGGDKEAFRVMTLTGGKAVDKDGNPLTIEAGVIYWTENPAASWGSIPGGDLAQLRGQTDNNIIRMAQLADIPVQRFQVSGQMSSADSQAADDSLLEVKVESQSTQLGNSWEGVMKKALRLWEEFGGGRKLNAKELASIQTIWGSFKRVDKVAEETARATMVETLVRAGASLPGALAQAGYTDAEIETLSQLDTVTGIEQ